jgi:hypothetical protein
MKNDCVVILDGRVIRTSKNLRGMRDYARVAHVVKVESRMTERELGEVTVTYADGATCTAEFKSYHIMVDFIRNRRTWRNAEHVMHGPDMGYLTKPGIIAGS